MGRGGGDVAPYRVSHFFVYFFIFPRHLFLPCGEFAWLQDKYIVGGDVHGAPPQ